ncbi:MULTISPECIES: family 16 glycosylhydrolase [unclassified Bradyrhizobium]|uniref:family 16 glycosylhydrolase n=1 Tax=unclassified Bradyrhizobium TaxID=2631580 RepID=UPI00247A6FCB|nr:MULTISPECIES: family 16 glycosylhydrolase [unclassified Bradyrhizobium]WGS18270.1 family 16 glycosylhydrolase [Bradyrhizobium sp. ISRA463]WGS25087.1 family 16 glycosylhydrolase [Bradyrhizobium sp. ISRA464]
MRHATRRTLLKGSVGLALTTVGPLTVFDTQAAAEGVLSFGDATITVVDTTVRSTELWAEVPVKLNAPTACTIVLEYETLNGNGTVGVLPGAATAGADFVTARGFLIFQPGDQVKLVKIRLVRPLAAGKSIVLQISDFGYPLFGHAHTTGEVKWSEQPPIVASYANDDVPLPPLPSHGSVIFSDRLLDRDFASDDGFTPSGTPCWQSRLVTGRRQEGNKELGYYADPALNPETTVWGIDPATGCRFIQAEYHKEGLSDGQGGKLAPGWRKETPFRFSAAMVTSRTLFNRITLNSYVEFNVRLMKVAGSWPGLWLLPVTPGWPPEIDVLEAYITASPQYREDVIFSSIHWKGEKGPDARGTAMPLGLVEEGANLFSRFNRFGCLIGKQQIVYYLNDKPYCAMPNLVGAGPWYMLMDVAIGGPAGEPSDPSAFPARMHIAGVKVIQF